jgi:hypothetical protein
MLSQLLYPLCLRFSEEALEEAGASNAVPPFAVVSSREMDASVGRYWPVSVHSFCR